MPSNAEIYRLLCNLLRIGTVTELDTEKHLARVACGENETDWLHWRASRAGDAVTWFPPSIGEQVIIASLNGELQTGVIIGSLYSNAAPPPTTDAKTCAVTFSDGATFTYDAASSTLNIAGVKSVTVQCETGEMQCNTAQITAKTSITLDAPEVICTKKLTAAELSITQGGEMNGAFTGSMTINDVKPDDHSHGGVETGSGRTKDTQ